MSAPDFSKWLLQEEWDYRDVPDAKIETITQHEYARALAVLRGNQPAQPWRHTNFDAQKKLKVWSVPEIEAEQNVAPWCHVAFDPDGAEYLRPPFYVININWEGADLGNLTQQFAEWIREEKENHDSARRRGKRLAFRLKNLAAWKLSKAGKDCATARRMIEDLRIEPIHSGTPETRFLPYYNDDDGWLEAIEKAEKHGGLKSP